MQKCQFQKPKKHKLSNLPHQTVEKLQKTMGSSEDPSLVNNVDELGLVYSGLSEQPEQEVYSDKINGTKKMKKKFVISLQKVIYWNTL